MPCIDYREHDYDRKVRQNMETAYSTLKDKVDNLTRMLCALTKTVGPSTLSQIEGLTEWDAEHRRLDALRLKAEKEKQRRLDLADERLRRRMTLLNGMSREDKIALGLDPDE